MKTPVKTPHMPVTCNQYYNDDLDTVGMTYKSSGILMLAEANEMSGSDCVVLFFLPDDHHYMQDTLSYVDYIIPTDNFDNFKSHIVSMYGECPDEMDIHQLYDYVVDNLPAEHGVFMSMTVRHTLIAHDKDDATFLFNTEVEQWKKSTERFEVDKLDHYGNAMDSKTQEWWETCGRPWRLEKLMQATVNYHSVK